MTLLMKRLLKKTTAPRKGFTLIEMVVVLAIIALLMLIVIPNLNTQRNNASKRQAEALTEVVQNQAEMYANDTGAAITEGTEMLKTLKDHDYINQGQYDQAVRQHINPVRPNNQGTNGAG